MKQHPRRKWIFFRKSVQRSGSLYLVIVLFMSFFQDSNIDQSDSLSAQMEDLIDRGAVGLMQQWAKARDIPRSRASILQFKRYVLSISTAAGFDALYRPKGALSEEVNYEESSTTARQTGGDQSNREDQTSSRTFLVNLFQNAIEEVMRTKGRFECHLNRTPGHAGVVICLPLLPRNICSTVMVG